MAGATRLLVTHQRQYLPSCDRVLVLRLGRLVAEGTQAELAAAGVPEVVVAQGECGMSAQGRWAALQLPILTALHCTALHCTALHCTALHLVVVPISSSLAGVVCARTEHPSKPAHQPGTVPCTVHPPSTPPPSPLCLPLQRPPWMMPPMMPMLAPPLLSTARAGTPPRKQQQQQQQQQQY